MKMIFKVSFCFHWNAPERLSYNLKKDRVFRNEITSVDRLKAACLQSIENQAWQRSLTVYLQVTYIT